MYFKNIRNGIRLEFYGRWILVGYNKKLTSEDLKSFPEVLKEVIEEYRKNKFFTKLYIISNLLIDRKKIEKIAFIKSETNYIKDEYLDMLKNEKVEKMKTYHVPLIQKILFSMMKTKYIFSSKKSYNTPKCEYLGWVVINLKD